MKFISTIRDNLSINRLWHIITLIIVIALPSALVVQKIHWLFTSPLILGEPSISELIIYSFSLVLIFGAMYALAYASYKLTQSPLLSASILTWLCLSFEYVSSVTIYCYTGVGALLSIKAVLAFLSGALMLRVMKFVEGKKFPKTERI